MSRNSQLGAVLYNTESSWGEDSTTFGTRLSVLDSVDVTGLTQSKIEPGRVFQHRNEGFQKISGPMGGTFKTKLWLVHGSATTGATSLNALETLLGYVFGAAAVSAASGTTLTGGTATVPTTTASGTFSAGALCRVGADADTRGNGQWYAISTHTTTTLTLLNALNGSPTNGDVLYSAATISTLERPSTDGLMTGLRFLIQTSNLRFECHGCWASAVSFGGLNAGEAPFIDVTWSCSWWRYEASSTFPVSTAMETFVPQVAARGSLHVSAVGTATRSLRSTVRSVSLDYTLGRAPQMGVNGVNQYQTVTGCIRTADDITFNWEEDAETASASPALANIWDGSTAYQVMYTHNNTATGSLGIYLPVCWPANDRPTQMAGDGVNRVKLSLKAHTTTTTTGDLTLSAFRMGLA